jgi:integrase
MVTPDLSRTHLPEPLDTSREPWSRDDILRALRALQPGSWSAWLFVIALTTGTRIGEPTAARKEWYDPNGFIRLPARFTKSRKRRVLPIIELIRPALEKHAAALPDGEYLFDAPRPSNEKLKIAHEASKSPVELVAANETVCAGFLDDELRTEIRQLVGWESSSIDAPV